MPGYHKDAHNEIAIATQVETKEALDNLEMIAAEQGAKGIFVGPSDLVASMGIWTIQAILESWRLLPTKLNPSQ